MKKILFFFLIFGMYTVSCNKDDDNDIVPVEEKSSYDKMMTYLEEKGGYDTYVQAMNMMEMDKVMGDVPLTPIVPTDKAFKECMDEYGYTSLEDFPKDKLKDLLKLHLVTKCSKELEDGDEYLPTMMMPKVGKNPINIFGRRPTNNLKNLENARFMYSRVVEEPKYIGSYFMHPVDKVIKPPKIKDFVLLDPRFEKIHYMMDMPYFEKLYMDIINADQEQTVLLPYNYIVELFMEWNGWVEFEDLEPAEMKWVVESHIIPSELVYKEELKAPLIEKALSGIDITLEPLGQMVNIYNGWQSHYKTDVKTVQADNGVVIVANMVAIPPYLE